MKHFLFEDREYKINPRFRRKRNEQDSAQALARLIKRINKYSRPGSGGSRGGLRKTDVRQKCVVKAQYSKNMKAHQVQLDKYLSREGTDQDGSRAKLYGTDLEEYQKNMVDKNFRIFLSPQSDKADLTDLTNRFVKKLELQTGYKLFWIGANHYNTAHPHAHLLINGVDKNGKEVNLPRDTVRTFMRETSRDICTSQLGNRTREELSLEKEKELTASRFTRLDETIKELCGGTYRVNLNEAEKDRKRILTRLEHLRKLNLCTYVDEGYRLSSKWEDNLKANGRYNTFLESRSSLQYSKKANLKVYSGEHGRITGKVTKVYRTDGDASDNHAVVLETLDGKAFFIPMFKKPELRDRDKIFELKAGDLVTLQTYKTQQGRLTPIIYKAGEKNLVKEIQKNGYTGTLAQSLINESKQTKLSIKSYERS